jgi:hypothetical protein
MGKPYDTTPWVATYCMEAHASEEVGSLSMSRVATSESNRVVLEANSCSNRSRQPLVGSSNHTQRQKHGDCGIVMLGGPRHLYARAHQTERYNKPNTEKPSSGVRGPNEDIKPAWTSPRLFEGTTHTGYDHSKWWRSDLISLQPEDRGNSVASRCSGARSTPAMAINPTIAPGTSVGYIHSDLSLTT